EVTYIARGAVDGIDEAVVIAIGFHQARRGGRDDPVGEDADGGGNEHDVPDKAEADWVLDNEPEADGEHDGVVEPGVNPVRHADEPAVAKECGLPTHFLEEAELLFEADEMGAASDRAIAITGADAAEEDVHHHDGGGPENFEA